MRPPAFSYPGSKAKMSKDICKFLPQSGHIYCEPFAGRGNVFWRAVGELHYDIWWLNDLRTIPWFKSLFIPPQLVPQERLSTPEMKDMIECAASEQEGLRLPAIALSPYLTFNGGGYDYAGQRAAGGGPGREAYMRSLDSAQRILLNNNVKLTEVDYKEVLALLEPNDTAYIDPPYINCDVGSYSGEDIFHQELVDILRNAPFRWVLSEYEHPIYKPLGDPFYRKNVNAHQAAAAKTKIECLWKNF